MIREKYQIGQKEVSLNITNGRIDSLRNKDIVKTGLRIYDGGNIGVAGCFGEPTEADWARAKDNLALKVGYDFEPRSNLVRERTFASEPDVSKFLSDMEVLLRELGKRHPQFVLSNKLNFQQKSYRMENDRGLSLFEMMGHYVFTIIVKRKNSPNILDTFLYFVGDSYEVSDLLERFSERLEAFERPVAMPKEEKLPMIFQTYPMMGVFSKHLNGDLFGRGASLFDGKRGEQLFSEQFSLLLDRREGRMQFFDAEGSTLDGDHIFLIEKGKLLRPYTDRANARKFDLEETACADCDYDEPPMLKAVEEFRVEETAKTLKEVLNGRLAIFCEMPSGGEYTSAGDYASPILSPYLTDGEKLLGQVPIFNVMGNVYEIFGKDFMGAFENPNAKMMNQLVLQMRWAPLG